MSGRVGSILGCFWLGLAVLGPILAVVGQVWVEFSRVRAKLGRCRAGSAHWSNSAQPGPNWPSLVAANLGTHGPIPMEFDRFLPVSVEIGPESAKLGRFRPLEAKLWANIGLRFEALRFEALLGPHSGKRMAQHSTAAPDDTLLERRRASLACMRGWPRIGAKTRAARHGVTRRSQRNGSASRFVLRRSKMVCRWQPLPCTSELSLRLISATFGATPLGLRGSSFPLEPQEWSFCPRRRAPRPRGRTRVVRRRGRTSSAARPSEVAAFRGGAPTAPPPAVGSRPSANSPRGALRAVLATHVRAVAPRAQRRSGRWRPRVRVGGPCARARRAGGEPGPRRGVEVGIGSV